MKRPNQYPSMPAEQFTAALKLLGWTQAEFADRCGLTKATVSRWSTGAVPVAPWVSAYTGALLDLAALHRKYLSIEPRLHVPAAQEAGGVTPTPSS